MKRIMVDVTDVDQSPMVTKWIEIPDDADRASSPSGSPESLVGPARPGSPFPLERGKVYVIEIDERIPPEAVMDIKEAFRKYEEAAGCMFMLLHSGLHLVRTSSLADPKPLPAEPGDIAR